MAETLTISDQQGLIRLKSETASTVDLEVKVKGKGFESLKLVASNQINTNFVGEKVSNGLFLIRSVPAGRYVIELKPASLTVHSVRIMK